MNASPYRFDRKPYRGRRSPEEYRRKKRDEMRAKRDAIKHPCPGWGAGRYMTRCARCAALDRERRIRESGQTTRRGWTPYHDAMRRQKETNMSNRRASTSPRSDVISQVMIDTGDITPPALKYPKGYLSNLPKENQVLMTRAAHAVGIAILFGAAKSSLLNEAKRRTYLSEHVGVYLAEQERQREGLDLYVKALMDTYQTMQVQEFQKRLADAQ